jgi:hypothetical protein
VATGKRLQHFTIATLVLGALIHAGPAAACSCNTTTSACQATVDGSVVFVGTVLSIDAVMGRDHRLQRRVQFEVVESFNGVTTPSVDIENDALDDCGYAFVVNQRYLVFANRDGKVGPLTTGICTRTRALEDAKQDLEYLREFASRPADGGTLSGTVRHVNQIVGPFRLDDMNAWYAPVAGVTASVQCQDRVVRRGETDAAGRFEFRGLPLGTCSLDLSAPPHTYVERNPLTVVIRDPRACTDFTMLIGFDGRIRGRVLAGGVLPVPGVTVYPFKPDGRGLASSSKAITDADGAFEFTRMSPGSYVIGISPQPLTANGQIVNGTLFYPGVRTLEAAEIVKLGPGARVDLGDLRMTDDVAYVEASGTVVNDRGVPLSGLKVYAARDEQASGFLAGPTVTDAQGRFTLAVPRGERVTVMVLPRVTGSGAVSFVADIDRTGLRIVTEDLRRKR